MAKRSVRRDPFVDGQTSAVTVVEQTASELYFDYSQLPDDHRDLVRRAALDIKPRLKRAAEDIFVIGEKLRDVKARLAHGTYTDWLEVEFGLSVRMAQYFVGVRERLGAKSEKFSFLPPSSLYLLAAPSTPDEAISAVEARIEAGERLTVAAVQEVVQVARRKQAAPPLKSRRVADQQLEEALFQARRRPLPPDIARKAGQLDDALTQIIDALELYYIELWDMLLPPGELDRACNDLVRLRIHLRRRLLPERQVIVTPVNSTHMGMAEDDLAEDELTDDEMTNVGR